MVVLWLMIIHKNDVKERTTTMKDIDIVASMFEEIKKSLEKLSKQKPSSNQLLRLYLKILYP